MDGNVVCACLGDLIPQTGSGKRRWYLGKSDSYEGAEDWLGLKFILKYSWQDMLMVCLDLKLRKWEEQLVTSDLDIP